MVKVVKWGVKVRKERKTRQKWPHNIDLASNE
jgi:hypothetical protein